MAYRSMASAWGVKTVPLQEDMALRVGAGVRYIGNTVSTGPTTVLKTPGYTIVDALVALDWNRWTAAIHAKNLFDKSYFSKCRTDRKRVVKVKGVSASVNRGGRRILTK